MPAYNAAGTIAPAIRSALAQTRLDFEVIVVDDGSTDETAAAVEAFLVDPRIQLIRQENRGLAGARNTALRRARGRYIALLDSDDLWLPHYLEDVLGLLEASEEIAYAYTDAWVLDEGRARFRRVPYTTLYGLPRPPDDPGDFLHALLESNFVFGSATIVRSVLEDVGGFDESLRAVEDYDLWLRLAARGHIGAFRSSSAVVYRERSGSLTRNPTLMTTSLIQVYRRAEQDRSLPADVRRHAAARRGRFETKLSMVSGRRRPLALTYGLMSRARMLRRSLPWTFHRQPPAELVPLLKQVDLRGL